MNEEQVDALKYFIYWSCQHAVAEATNCDRGEYNRMCQAEKRFDELMKPEDIS